ncbi:hypothetical protein KM043_004908 [Ampulex compressa]|nr:hypothetical protein KM043_004908 [Ampulex compressa]
MATEAVYKYLKMQNRPYSVNDVVSNLHNEFGKSAVQKAFDQLTMDGKIFEKVYGKQKVYCVVQDTKCDMEELVRIDRELQVHANEVESKYQDIEKEIKMQEALLASLRSSITLEEGEKEKAVLKKSIKALAHKLDELMESTNTENLSESKRKAERTIEEYSREYSKRKRLCTEIIDCILENYPGSKRDLYEEVGIEAKIVR